jgi:hypothetical protein
MWYTGLLLVVFGAIADFSALSFGTYLSLRSGFHQLPLDIFFAVPWLLSACFVSKIIVL